MSDNGTWRNRIVGHGEEAPDQLLANPRNWRIHPKAQQAALEGVLNEVGWVQDVVVNQRTGHLIDGHLRVTLALRRDEATIPVVYVDLDEAEEALVLASLDPLSAMAAADREQLDALLHEVQTGDEQLQLMLDSLAVKAGVVPPVDYEKEWQGMPEFEQEDLKSFRQIIVHFQTQDAVDAFSQLMEQTITDRAKYIWYPKAEIMHQSLVIEDD